ncbi:MAG: DUF1932 domain-containing protein [Candidatus Promineifilaceae bacterium]|nr:DUF1932 domain-containing protein [Candidatus Promineifilaceae bacterium]
MKFAILGLGEAGGALAADLVGLGATVFGWDPVPRSIPEGVHFMAGNPEAVRQADVVLSVNWASAAIEVAEEVLSVLRAEQLYADMNTASPRTKQQVAQILHQHNILFADVAIMAPILPRGIRTPTLASGPGADKYQQMMSTYHMPVSVVDNQAGSAATRKLLRSIVYKGIAAVIIEAQEAAKEFDCEAWLREQMLTLIDQEATIERMIVGSRVHAKRRIEEMTAVSEMLRELGVAPHMSEAAVQWLTDLQRQKETND